MSGRRARVVWVRLLLWAAMVFLPTMARAFEVPAADRVETTPHAVTVWFGDKAVRITKAPGPDERPRDAVCTTNGVSVRAEQADDPEIADALARLCAQLETDAPVLTHPSPQPPKPRGPMWTGVLAGLGLLWWLGLPTLLPRNRVAWGIAGVAGLARLAAGPSVLMSVSYPYERMLTWAGVRAPSDLYGHGWTGVLGWVRPLVGHGPDLLLPVNAMVSTLTVLLVWQVARVLSDDARVAHAAACTLAVLPLPVSLAYTETYFVLVAALQATAVVGLLRDDAWGAGMAALSAVLLAHTRPLQAAVAVVVVIALWTDRRRGFAAAALLGMAARWWTIWLTYDAPGLLVRHAAPWVGRDAMVALFDPWRTPFWLVPLAVVGLRVLASRPQRSQRILWAMLAVTALPCAFFPLPIDVARFQLPAQTWWAVAAGAGLSAAWSWSSSARLCVGVAIVGGLWVARQPRVSDGVPQVAYDLVPALCDAASGQVVRYDAVADTGNAWGRYLRVRCGIRALPYDGTTVFREGAWVWIGQGATHPEASARPARESLAPVVEARAAPSNGALWPLPQDGVTVGLYRVATRHAPAVGEPRE